MIRQKRFKQSRKPFLRKSRILELFPGNRIPEFKISTSENPLYRGENLQFFFESKAFAEPSELGKKERKRYSAEKQATWKFLLFEKEIRGTWVVSPFGAPQRQSPMEILFQKRISGSCVSGKDLVFFFATLLVAFAKLPSYKRLGRNLLAKRRFSSGDENFGNSGNSDS
jgi:hypothetical protein